MYFSTPFKQETTLTNSNSSSSDCTQHIRGIRELTKTVGTCNKFFRKTWHCILVAAGNFTEVIYITNDVTYSPLYYSWFFKIMGNSFKFSSQGFKAHPTLTHLSLHLLLHGPLLHTVDAPGTLPSATLHLHIWIPASLPQLGNCCVLFFPGGQHSIIKHNTCLLINATVLNNNVCLPFANPSIHMNQTILGE